MTKFLSCWVEDTAMNDMASPAIMIMPSLMLKKPSEPSKLKYHLILLFKENQKIQKSLCFV